MHTLAKVVGLFAAVILLGAQSASAQAKAPAKQGCENAKSQADMNACAAAEFATADKDLNAYYAEFEETLDAALLKKLQAAQRAWINYRDADCDAEATLYEGGSVQPMMRSGCLARVTRDRIAELHAIYDKSVTLP